jgi:hypothetical protein
MAVIRILMSFDPEDLEDIDKKVEELKRKGTTGINSRSAYFRALHNSFKKQIG